MFVIKNNLVHKTSKKWWPVTFGTVSVGLLIARKNTGACYTSALSCHTAPCRAQQCWKQVVSNTVVHDKALCDTSNKTKSIRPRPRPVWDRSCHKTAVSDPEADNADVRFPSTTLSLWNKRRYSLWSYYFSLILKAYRLCAGGFKKYWK